MAKRWNAFSLQENTRAEISGICSKSKIINGPKFFAVCAFACWTSLMGTY